MEKGLNLREINADKVPLWEEYCQKEWEHGPVVTPVTRLDLEKPPPEGVTKLHLLAEAKGDIAAGVSLVMSDEQHMAAYGHQYWLDMWVVDQARGAVEADIIALCETLMKEQGITTVSCRIPHYQSRFTDIFKKAGYKEEYKEDTFIREGKTPIDEVIYSYYEQAQQKVHLRVSEDLEKDIQTYISMVNEISAEVPNITPLYEDHLYSAMYDGKRHMIGVWIFAEVDSVPAGFISGLVSFQQLFGKNQIVGRVLNNGVLKQFRGMGIGTALYVKMVEEMKKWNAAYILDYMVMEDNIPERTLLKELGFEPAQKHVLMKKSL